MGNVYVLKKQDDSGFAGTALQMDSSGQGSLQIPIGGKGMTGPLRFLPYLTGGYGALRTLASRDQSDLGSALSSAGMAGLTNYSTFDQLGAGAERLFRDRFGRENVLHVIKFLCVNSVEERIEEIIKEKKYIFDEIVEETAKKVPRLSEEELMKIVS